MLDRLERDYGVHARIGNGQTRDRGRLERDRRPGIPGGRLLDDPRIDIDTEHRVRDFRQKHRAVALAASGIEDAPALHETAREGVSMAVFVGDFSDHSGKVSLASEFFD